MASGAGIDDLDGDGGTDWGANVREVSDILDLEAGWNVALLGYRFGAAWALIFGWIGDIAMTITSNRISNVVF